MRRWAFFVGGFLVFIGLVSLVEAIWKIDLGKFFWPLVLDHRWYLDPCPSAHSSLVELGFTVRE